MFLNMVHLRLDHMESQVYFYCRCVFSFDLKETLKFISFSLFILKIKEPMIYRKCVAQVHELCAEVKLLLVYQLYNQCADTPSTKDRDHDFNHITYCKYFQFSYLKKFN